MTQETAGNGVVTNRSFSPNTGRLTAIQAGVGGGTGIANYSYGYDLLGNLTSRADAKQSLTETFGYDVLDRLTSYTVNGTSYTATYTSAGNINTRPQDAGTCGYSGNHGGPHAVSSITSCAGCTTHGTTNPSFSYDASGDGTMVSGAGRAITWTPFDMVSAITAGTTSVTFSYGPEHQMVKRQTLVSASPTDTTVFLTDTATGISAEASTDAAGVLTWRDYLYADGRVIGARLKTGVANPNWRYITLDHLGSVSILANNSGAVQERLSYGAWGQRRCANGSSGCSGSGASQIDIGFTGHVMVDAFNLISMGARTYDPEVGRFMSGDPLVSVFWQPRAQSLLLRQQSPAFGYRSDRVRGGSLRLFPPGRH